MTTNFADVPPPPEVPTGTSRRRFLSAGAGIALAAGLAPVLGAGMPACSPGSTEIGAPTGPPQTNPTTTTAPPVTQPPQMASAGVGYNIWDNQAFETANVNAIRTMRPSLVRMNLSWELWQPNQSPADFERLRPFLTALADVGATLWLQVKVQDAIPYFARMSTFQNIPKPGTYQAFLDPLVAMIGQIGTKVVHEAWNEPDLRWTNTGGVENFTNPWTIDPFNIFQGSSGWTGGAGDYFAALHTPGRTYGSNGIFEPGWVPKTASLFQYLDLHEYFLDQPVSWFLNNVKTKLASYDAVRPGLPFVIGEAATSPDPWRSTMNADPASEFPRHKERHQALIDTYGARYLGMMSIAVAQKLDGTNGAWWA